MRTIRAALAAGVLAAAGALSVPAAAAPAGLPSFEQLRAALLTVAELPSGLKPTEDRQGQGGDSDFAAWDRCGDPEPAAGVRMVAVDYATEGAEPDGVSMFLGAPGAGMARAIVASELDAAQRCPGRFGTDLPVTQWVHPRLGDSSLVFGHHAVIAQGDVLMYFATQGYGDTRFRTLAEAVARKLAEHFPSRGSGDRMAELGGERPQIGLAEPLHQ